MVRERESAKWWTKWVDKTESATVSRVIRDARIMYPVGDGTEGTAEDRDGLGAAFGADPDFFYEDLDSAIGVEQALRIMMARRHSPRTRAAMGLAVARTIDRTLERARPLGTEASRKRWRIAVVIALDTPNRHGLDRGPRIHVAEKLARGMAAAGDLYDALRALAYRTGWCEEDYGMGSPVTLAAHEAHCRSLGWCEHPEDAFEASARWLRCSLLVRGLTESVDVVVNVAVFAARLGRVEEATRRLVQAENIAGSDVVVVYSRERVARVLLDLELFDAALAVTEGALAAVTAITSQGPKDADEEEKEAGEKVAKDRKAVCGVIRSLYLHRASALSLTGDIHDAVDIYATMCSVGADWVQGVVAHALGVAQLLLDRDRQVEWLHLSNSVIDLVRAFDDGNVDGAVARLDAALRAETFAVHPKGEPRLKGDGAAAWTPTRDGGRVKHASK